jgi:hypothetical protein
LAVDSAVDSDSFFEARADLQAGTFRGIAEGRDAADESAYSGISSRLRLTNNTGETVVIGAGDFVAHVQGDYTFGPGPNQSVQTNTSFQVRINGGIAYIAGSRHNLAVGYVIGNPGSTFDVLFEQNGASVALTTASLSQLVMDLIMPELTLLPGAFMDVNVNNDPAANTSVFNLDHSGIAGFDFFNGANGLTLGLVLPAGVTLDSDSTVPLDWITNVPVPGAVWLFGSALALLGWMRRKAA